MSRVETTWQFYLMGYETVGGGLIGVGKRGEGGERGTGWVSCGGVEA